MSKKHPTSLFVFDSQIENSNIEIIKTGCTADNLTVNIELVHGDRGAVFDKLGEVQKKIWNPSTGRPRVGARRRRSPAGKCRGSAYEDAGSGRAEDARQQVAQVAVGAERARGCGGRSAAARALGGAAGALGGASDRVGARIGSPPVGPHFS